MNVDIGTVKLRRLTNHYGGFLKHQANVFLRDYYYLTLLGWEMRYIDSPTTREGS